MNKEILIKKYLKNKCSDKEFEEVVKWVKGIEKNFEGKNWGFEQWQSLDPELNEKDKEIYSTLLHKIHHEINLRDNEKENSRVVSLSIVTKWLSHAAAILFIPLLGFLFFLLSRNNFQNEFIAELKVDSVEVIAPIGSRTVVQLSDGTEVNLNYGSRMKYPRNFSGDYREIKLTGEGYFDVTHNPEKPFIVKTGNLNVKALGTQFNVQAYSDDDVVSTTLVEGKVVIEKITSDNKTLAVGAMVPGQHVEYNKSTGNVTSSKGSISKYIAWTDGKLVFDNEPITGVAEKLGRMFNVEIEIAANARDLTYTVTFLDDPLFLILDLMAETTPIKYTILPRKRQPDGTFSKQKIKIEKR